MQLLNKLSVSLVEFYWKTKASYVMMAVLDFYNHRYLGDPNE